MGCNECVRLTHPLQLEIRQEKLPQNHSSSPAPFHHWITQNKPQEPLFLFFLLFISSLRKPFLKFQTLFSQSSLPDFELNLGFNWAMEAITNTDLTTQREWGDAGWDLGAINTKNPNPQIPNLPRVFRESLVWLRYRRTVRGLLFSCAWADWKDEDYWRRTMAVSRKANHFAAIDIWYGDV